MAGCCESDNEPSFPKKLRGIYGVGEQLLAPQEGLCCRVHCVARNDVSRALEGMRKKRTWRNLRQDCCLGFFLDGLKKNTMKSGQDNRCLLHDSKLSHPEFKTDTLLLVPVCWLMFMVVYLRALRV